MKNMRSTARKLDILFHILQVLVTIATVCTLVGMVIIAAFFLFRLTPDQVGTGYSTLQLGFLELELSSAATPNPSRILSISAVNLAMGFVTCLIYRVFIKSIRQIIMPMKEGLPFQGIVSENLKKLAVYTVILGIVSNIMDCVNLALTLHCYDLTRILINKSISHVTVMHEFDLSFLALGAVLLLLSYVFRYGEELQQLSDETL